MICNNLGKCVDKELNTKSALNCDNHKICIQSSDNRSNIKCEEKQKKYIFENTQRNHIISYKMDGGIIVEDKYVPIGTNRCDYLYVGQSNSGLNAILIELKGVDVPKALKQLYDTLQRFNGFFLNCSSVYGRIIVTSSTPNLKASPQYVKLLKEFRKLNGNIKMAQGQLKEKDIELGI